MLEHMQILRSLSKYAIVVGSAARSDQYNDIDLVVSEKGLYVAKRVMDPWDSIFPMAITSEALDPQIEVFCVWYGPSYADLRRSTELTTVTLYNIELRAWPGETRDSVHERLNQEKA